MDDMKKDLQENLSGGGFMKFEKMITPGIIQVLFILGLIVTTLIGLGSIVSGITSTWGGGAKIFMGLLTLILGPVFVRVYCELLIVIFKIYEALQEIRRKL